MTAKPFPAIFTNLNSRMGALMTDGGIVFETENLQLFYQPTSSSEFAPDLVVVTFNTAETTGGGRFWGDSFFNALGVTAIGFVATSPNWFPPRDVADAISIVKKLLNGRDCVTYGYSQGGYGALKFSRSLGAIRAVAFSPQWSINPIDVASFDNRYAAYFKSIEDGGGKIIGSEMCNDSYIVHDPLDHHDVCHVRKLLEISNAKSVVVPFAAHKTIHVLSETGCASAAIRQIFERDINLAKKLRCSFREARRGSGIYKRGRTRRLIEERRVRPFSLARDLQRHTGKPEELIYVACMLHRMGSVDTARRLIASISDEVVSQADLLDLLEIFHEIKFRDGDIKIANLFRIKYPNDVVCRLNGVNVMARIGYREDAAIEVRAIAELDTAINNANLLISIACNVQAVDVAERFIERCISHFPEDDRTFNAWLHFMDIAKNTNRDADALRSLENNYAKLCTNIERKQHCDTLMRSQTCVAPK